MQSSSIYLLDWLTLIPIFSLAVISPGPDFIIVMKNSVIYSRRTGVLTALGLGLGCVVHVTYSIIGLGAILSESLFLFNLIKWIGAAYLIFIGWKSLCSKGPTQQITNQDLVSLKEEKVLNDGPAIRLGFLTNVLNPKAALFFVAIFSQVIHPNTPVYWKILDGVSCSMITVGWFSTVAYIVTQNYIKTVFFKATKKVDKVCGILMIALGVKVALMSK